jgi:hypothetical protein
MPGGFLLAVNFTCTNTIWNFMTFSHSGPHSMLSQQRKIELTIKIMRFP